MLSLFNVVKLASHVYLCCVSIIQWGETPLDRAREYGHTAVVSLLEKETHSSELTMLFKDRM